MERLTVQKTMEKWGISWRTVQQLSMGRPIPGAKKSSAPELSPQGGLPVRPGFSTSVWDDKGAFLW